MATGDQADMLARLKRQLPRWFDQGVSPTPVLDAFLSGPAWALSFAHGIVTYGALQVRLGTMSDGWLDLFSGDFFGPGLPRRTGQGDGSYRALLQASLIRERVTRPAIVKLIEDITGRTPVIVEPRRVVDGCVYDGPGGYNVGRRYGSLNLSVVFIEVYRPLPGSQWDGIEDADIYAALASIRPAATKFYARILDNPPA